MKIITFAFFIFFSFNSYSQTIFRCENGTIQFRSDAELELIKASSNKLAGVIDTAKKIFAFSVNINSFEGFNGALQREHFNENYMQSERYPKATFKGKIIEDIDFSKPGTYAVRTKGVLSIHGVDQERIIKSTLIIMQDHISIESAFTVFLKDHNIKIPKVVHENIASEIEVEVKADMKSVMLNK